MPTLPPNEKTAEWIHIRIHKEPKNLEYKTFFERQFDSFIAAYETHSNRPHIHVLVRIKVTRSVQLRNLMKKMFKFNGNTDFQVKNVVPTAHDFQAISQYICKGDNAKTLPAILYNSLDWTEEKIKENHKLYWEVNHIDQEPEQKVIHVDLSQVPLPKEKIVRKTWTEKIIEELDTEYPDQEWDWFDERHKEFMIEYVLRKLGEKKKIFNEYKLKEFVYACFNSLDAKNFRTDITAKVRGIL